MITLFGCMTHKTNYITTCSKLLFLTLLFAPFIVFGQAGVNNLVDIPVADSSSFGGYINALYLLAISIAAVLAVIKLIIAGVKYMLSDVVTNKASAKADIKGALLGLLLILAAVLILEVINPSIGDNNAAIERFQTVQGGVRGVGNGVAPSGPAVNSSGQTLAPQFYDKNITEYGDINQSAVTRNGNVFSYDINSICGNMTGSDKQDCIEEEADNFGDFCENNLSRGYVTNASYTGGGRANRYSGTPSQTITCTLPTSYVSEQTVENNMPAGADWEDTCSSWGGTPYTWGSNMCIWYRAQNLPPGVTL